MTNEEIDEDGLTAWQHTAVAALLSKPTIKAAAKAAKVSEKTLHQWLKLPAFKRVFRVARQQIVQHAVAQMGVSLTRAAVDTLKRNLRCKVPAVEVRAAIGVLDKVIAAEAVEDLRQEIDELRLALEQRNGLQSGGPAGGSAQAPGAGGAIAVGGGPDALPVAGGPDAPVPPGGPDPGPVAGAVPLGPVAEADDPRVQAGGEEFSGGSPDADALFD